MLVLKTLTFNLLIFNSLLVYIIFDYVGLQFSISHQICFRFKFSHAYTINSNTNNNFVISVKLQFNYQFETADVSQQNASGHWLAFDKLN
jgi:hypothetical protein